jgi:hypothetical protein
VKLKKKKSDRNEGAIGALEDANFTENGKNQASSKSSQ